MVDDALTTISVKLGSYVSPEGEVGHVQLNLTPTINCLFPVWPSKPSHIPLTNTLYPIFPEPMLVVEVDPLGIVPTLPPVPKQDPEDELTYGSYDIVQPVGNIFDVFVVKVPNVERVKVVIVPSECCFLGAP